MKHPSEWTQTQMTGHKLQGDRQNHVYTIVYIGNFDCKGLQGVQSDERAGVIRHASQYMQTNGKQDTDIIEIK